MLSDMKDKQSQTPPKGEIVIYQTKDKTVQLKVKLEQETVWLSRADISRLFRTERSVITKHLRNIFKSNELDRDSVCAKIAHTASDGKVYQTTFYNLDVIISVGYRVNSSRATQFRIWATNIGKREEERLFRENHLDIVTLLGYNCNTKGLRNGYS